MTHCLDQLFKQIRCAITFVRPVNHFGGRVRFCLGPKACCAAAKHGSPSLSLILDGGNGPVITGRRTDDAATALVCKLQGAPTVSFPHHVAIATKNEQSPISTDLAYAKMHSNFP
jgi:hypothetical protein